VRSVCFMRWPARLPRGRTVSEIAAAIDLMPTLTALAGVARVGDKPLDGRDLTPLLFGQKDAWPERMLFSAWGGKISARTQQYRMNAGGQLFDMLADGGQTRNVASEQTAVAGRLQQAVAAWRAEVYGPDEASKLERGNVIDPRPIPVGYPEFPITMLPARDGVPQGGVKRSSGAPNSSYFVNWTSKEDTMVWNVDVQTAGAYEVTVDYTCPLSDVGSQVELSLGDAKVSGRVTPGWDPPLWTNQDTIERPKGESQMKEFHTLTLGTIRLDEGLGPLTLRALEIPGKSVMDVRRVTLTLKK